MNPIDVLKYGNRTFLYSIRELPQADWETPGVCGYWSVREIIAHLASFEYILLDALACANGALPGHHLTEFLRDGQAFNDTQVPARAGLSPSETLAEYRDTQARAMSAATSLPADRFRINGFLPQYGREYDLEDLIAYSFYGHKREHSAQIAVFRDRIGR